MWEEKSFKMQGNPKKFLELNDTIIMSTLTNFLPLAFRSSAILPESHESFFFRFGPNCKVLEHVVSINNRQKDFDDKGQSASFWALGWWPSLCDLQRNWTVSKLYLRVARYTFWNDVILAHFHKFYKKDIFTNSRIRLRSLICFFCDKNCSRDRISP